MVKKISHVEVPSLVKEGLGKMLSNVGQMTEGCEKRENLSLYWKKDREVVLACILPIMSRVILVLH